MGFLAIWRLGMNIDVLHALVFLAGFVCIGIVIILAVLHKLVLRDGGEGGLAGCLGTCLTFVMLGLGVVFFIAGIIIP
jgi:hypothetical protein